MTKKLITLLLALTMVFACAVPSFATVAANQPISGGNSYYVQSTLSDYYVDGQITVQLHVTSFKKPGAGPIDCFYDVTLGTVGATNQLFTVLDVLNAAHSQNPTLSFTIQTAYISQYDAYDSTVTGVADTDFAYSESFDAGLLYRSGTPYVCGHMYRINGMVPYFTHTNVNGVSKTEGCKINDAYVTANDIVDLYYMNIYTQNLATKVRAIEFISSTKTGSRYTATLRLLEAECYYDTDMEDWELTQWSPVANETVSIKVNGSAKTVTTDSNGLFTITPLYSGSRNFRFTTTWDTSYYYPSGSTGNVYQIPAILGIKLEHTF